MSSVIITGWVEAGNVRGEGERETERNGVAMGSRAEEGGIRIGLLVLLLLLPVEEQANQADGDEQKRKQAV